MAKNKMIEIETKSGFKVKIDPEIGNDMEIIDEFTAIATGKANFMPIELVKRMVGEGGQQALYDHCRNENGRVQADKVGIELTEILNQAAVFFKKK